MVNRLVAVVAVCLIATPLAMADLLDDVKGEVATSSQFTATLACASTGRSPTTGCADWSDQFSPAGGAAATGMALSQYGDHLYVSAVPSAAPEQAHVLVYSTQTGARLTTIELPGAYAASYPQVTITSLARHGERLYVAGGAMTPAGDWNAMLVAFHTGAQQPTLSWSLIPASPGYDIWQDMAVSPDGRLFVTGKSCQGDCVMKVAAVDDVGPLGVVAWADTLPEGAESRGRLVALDPPGWDSQAQPARVFFGGSTHATPGAEANVLIAAYEQASGGKQWVRVDGRAGDNQLTALVSDGARAYTGTYTTLGSSASTLDARVTAWYSYRLEPAVDGVRAWSRQIGSLAGERAGECFEGALNLIAVEDALYVALAAQSMGVCPRSAADVGLDEGATGQDFLLAALQARTGANLWRHDATPYTGQSIQGHDTPFDLVASPGDNRLLAAGISSSLLTGSADLTVSAVSASDGIPGGTVRYVDPDGRGAGAAGSASNPALLSYRPRLLMHPSGDAVFLVGSVGMGADETVVVAAFGTDQL